MVTITISSLFIRIFWESTKFEGHTDKIEPWYGTAYSVEKITVSMIQQWMESAPDEHLHLPAPNVFIPTDLSLKNVVEMAKFPLLLRKSSYSRLWYKPDTMFSTPKAFVRIDFNCPYAGNSPEAEVLTDIFTRLLMDYLNEYAYYAQVAGLYYAINHTDNGFQAFFWQTRSDSIRCTVENSTVAAGSAAAISLSCTSFGVFASLCFALLLFSSLPFSF
ncbi:hypothetical protein TEA_024513 [Camellia sinensis var. sinensis]|uniref:Peptidase M16 middle/third domain-containing protein n=1 Tax=Camellia sinensis var. sinensis TaxID=542762 RepID=A0A4S4D0X8_CAMSN|nr:hypothetical protein TEA_024513 [Camellia sinensis var. sinensis]